MKKVAKQNKIKKISKKSKAREYPAYMLGIALFVALASEAAVLAPATPADWQASLSVLDMSSGISSTALDLKLAFEPATMTAQAVNEFYAQAADVATSAVDLSNPNPDMLTAVFAVNNFYKEATQQMASILDLSNYTTHYEDNWQPQVAGASIRAQEATSLQNSSHPK